MSHASPLRPIHQRVINIGAAPNLRVLVVVPRPADACALLVDRQVYVRYLLREPARRAIQFMLPNRWNGRIDSPYASRNTAEACADNNDLYRLVLVDAEVTQRMQLGVRIRAGGV